MRNITLVWKHSYEWVCHDKTRNHCEYLITVANHCETFCTAISPLPEIWIFVWTLLQSKFVAVHQGKQLATQGKKSLVFLSPPISINKVFILNQLHHCHLDPTIWNPQLSLPHLFRLADDFHFNLRKEYLSTSALDLYKRITKVLIYTFQCRLVCRLLLPPIQNWSINFLFDQRSPYKTGSNQRGDSGSQTWLWYLTSHLWSTMAMFYLLFTTQL